MMLIFAKSSKKCGDKMNNENKPLVSIVVVTYNHEKFISQALDGILMQKTNFKYEIIVGDDASTDNTASIIRKYADNANDLFVTVLREKNVGAINNFVDLISKTRGKYVAICDGDDYWTDREKLQKQINFLEKNQEYSGCCHPVTEIFEDNSNEPRTLNPLQLAGLDGKGISDITIQNLITMNTVASLSVVLRWNISRILPKWIKKNVIGDYPILLLHAAKGPIKVLPDIMGIYRRHAAGIWREHAGSKEQKIRYVQLLKDVDVELNKRYNKKFRQIIKMVEDEYVDKKDNAYIDKSKKRKAIKMGKKIVGKILPDRMKNTISGIYNLENNLKYIYSFIRETQGNFTKIQSQNIEMKEELKDDKNKIILLWDALTWINKKNLSGKPKDFLGLMRYYISLGNFNEFYDNYDSVFSDKEEIKKWISCVNNDYTMSCDNCLNKVGKNTIKAWEKAFVLLNDEDSKDIFVRLLVWRILGFTKVKLLSDQQVAQEKKAIESLQTQILHNENVIHGDRFDLQCYNLNVFGYDLNCYTIPMAVVMDFVRKQYENEVVYVNKGDVVLDCGACWGDTSLLFAYMAGDNGHVFSFEYVPSNILIFNKNMKLNEKLAQSITLEKFPLSNKTGDKIMVNDKGPSSSISNYCFDKNADAMVETMTIDDFVKEYNLKHIDFIKMDIEGAEIDAILGAKDTIKKFKPKLALSIYHKPDDIWEIPILINEILPDYKMYIKHNSRSSIETVLLAIIE